ncbi:MAG: hypothetical protein GYB68_11275 [Chloroflexi bacterium]|nr:hypothetical protein [Chloroflexota bacterium]
MVLRVSIALIVLAVASPFILRGAVALLMRPSTHTVESVPERRVALIFGARVYSSGRLSAMLADRVATGVDLYQAGKVDLLIMSGDGVSPYYNEPDAMRRYAMELGVPEEDIVVDYLGTRTYDSCYRARHIFGVTDAITVTQNFHLDRTILTCSALGIDAVGVWADYQRPWGYSERSLSYSRTREIPALAVAVVDVVRQQPPDNLGEPMPLFSSEVHAE